MGRRRLKKAITASSALLFVGGFMAGGCSGGETVADGGSMMDGSMTSDAGAGDAAIDTKFKDTMAADNQPMCPTPETVSNFMPPAFIMPNAVQNVCTTGNGGQIQGYWDNCRAPQATMQGCATWKSNNATCAACIETKRTDMTWGALVVGNGITFLNISGCEQLRNQTQCAKDYQALGFCDYAACDNRCPVTDFFQTDHASTLMQWQTCSQQADMSTCSSFLTKVNSSCAGDAGASCLNFQSFQDGYFQYGPMFCSGGG